MAVYFSCLLIIFGITGIYSITTVSQVSVKAKDSITIPCLYEEKYRNHVKYLCKGYIWPSCSYAVKTNQPDRTNKFSISDDKTKRIFSVTIKDLNFEDTGYYWCAVEINGDDVRKKFHLSVSTGNPSLYVDRQENTAVNGDNTTIYFHNSNSGETKWCKLSLQGTSCVTGSSGSIDRTKVTIHLRAHNVFSVTMSMLTTESSGWYLCVKGDLQIPVHLTVTEKPSTTTFSTPLEHTTVREDKANNTVNHRQDSALVKDLKNYIIPLTVLIFIVMVASFIWFKLKSHKQSKVESSATIKAEEEVIYCDVKQKSKTSDQSGHDVLYCNVGYMGGTSGQMSYNTDVDVIYSSVVTDN